MNHSEVLALFDKEQRREIEIPGMRKDEFPRLVRFVRPSPGMSFVLYSDLDEATVDDAIESQIAYFSEEGLTFEWKAFAHDRPADLVERLVARGFEAEEQDAIMVLDVHNARIAEAFCVDIKVRRLSNPSELEEVIRILEPVWGEDFSWVNDRLGGHMALPGYVSVYVAYLGEVAAATGWIYFGPGHFASMWGGSTLETYRGRGLYTALLAARVAEAKERGLRYLTIDAGPMSRPIVARHGFEVITYATACEWNKGGSEKA